MSKTIYYIMGNLIVFGYFQNVICAADEWHGSSRIKDLYHHGSTVVCLGRCSELTSEELTHVLNYHLKEDIKFISFKNQPNLNDNHLNALDRLGQVRALVELDLTYTNITYNGIVNLWRSDTFGSKRDDEPVYERRYRKPVSVIKIEIGHTPALNQYKICKRPDGRPIFPLPLRDGFSINYTDFFPMSDSSVILEGFKDIVLMDHKTPLL